MVRIIELKKMKLESAQSRNPLWISLLITWIYFIMLRIDKTNIDYQEIGFQPKRLRGEKTASELSSS